MDTAKRPAVVELVTHTSACINGQHVVLHKREWVRSDDPRLAPPCGYKIVTDQSAQVAKPAEETNQPAEENPTLPATQPRAAVPQADTAEAGSAAEPECAESKSMPVASARAKSSQTAAAQTEGAQTSVAATSVAQTAAAQITAASPATSFWPDLSIPKTEPQQEVEMSSDEFNEDEFNNEDELNEGGYYEDGEAEADEQDEDVEIEAAEEEDEDDRPWPVTKATLAEIDEMSPSELKDLIENVGQHERWKDLREDAKLRTSQWLSGLKKAKAAPRCQFLKADGTSCGSPAVKGETLCHYHAQAQARRAAEEARKLEMTALDDRASIQLALVRVCHHLVEKSIDERTGRAIISALRLAQRNLGEQESIL